MEGIIILLTKKSDDRNSRTVHGELSQRRRRMMIISTLRLGKTDDKFNKGNMDSVQIKSSDYP